MSNLFGIGLSGLNAAQAGLNTTGNNISNVNTPGYTRRQTLLTEVNNNAGAGGGVQVTGIQRQYAEFLTSQLNDAQSTAQASNTHLERISQVNGLLSDNGAGIPEGIQDFFDSLSKLSGSPTDSSARNAVLGDARDMASQFRSFSQTLGKMQDNVNQQLGRSVDTLNSKTSQIARLNDKIADTQSRTGQAPNALLDKRDQLVSETSRLVNIEVTTADNGRYNLTAGGQSLVDVTGSHKLTVVDNADDPTQKRIGYVGADGNTRQIDSARVAGGEIGGLLSFASDSLEPAQAKLDQTAHALATRLNAQHREGTDFNGDAGENLFNPTSQPRAFASDNNNSDARLTATFDPDNTQSVTADNYRVSFNDGAFQVTRSDNGQAVSFETRDDGQTLSFGGMDVAVSGNPADGDRFTVRPLDNAAARLEVSITDPAELAAGQGGGRGDNTNAAAMVNLQQANVVEGSRSFSGNVSQMVGDIGNKTQSLQVGADSQNALTGELTKAQQSVAGVNLDEEFVNLNYFQQMYQANARVIQTASTVFDTILGLGN